MGQSDPNAVLDSPNLYNLSLGYDQNVVLLNFRARSSTVVKHIALKLANFWHSLSIATATLQSCPNQKLLYLNHHQHKRTIEVGQNDVCN